MSETLIQFIAAASVPSVLFSAVVGIVVWHFKRTQEKKDKAQAQKDNSIIEFFAMSIKATNASIAMGEAIGTAVARIPDAHCNGDMHKALEHASKVKHEMREYITNQGVHHIFDD
jgi:hypothetical protein